MPIPRKYKQALTEIRKLLKNSPLPLTEISRQSGVSYTALWKFHNGKQESIQLIDGEKVYYFLTGGTFLGLK